ncbi:MAG: hypothetical protein COA79_17850 [Planctomycetota bacterium]|nr:MAG: hypothetical protein COA79_17850 [Planctomycetota bacterium]
MRKELQVLYLKGFDGGNNEEFKQKLNENDVVENALKTLLVIDADSSKYFKLQKLFSEAIKTGHKSQQLYFLFLSHLCLAYLNFQQLENGKAVFSIIDQMDLQKYPSWLIGQYYNLKGYYYFMMNKPKLANDAYLNSMKHLKRNNELYRSLLANYAGFLSSFGLLNSLPDIQLNDFIELREDHHSSLSHLLRNMLYTGNLENLSSEMIQEYKSMYATNKSIIMDPVEIDIAFSLYEFNFEKLKLTKNSKVNTKIKFLELLLEGKINEAFNSIKKVDGNTTLQFLGIFKMIPYQIAVETMNESVINEIDEKEPPFNYLLDLFVARYYLKANNIDKARFHFKRLYGRCIQLKALNRLKLEIRLAPELEPEQVFDLMLSSSQEIKIFPSKDSSIPKISTSLLVGHSIVMQNIKKLATLYADIPNPVLILGETGTGKELITKLIVQKSKRKNKPLLVINCGAISETLLESELFGYEAGAFTGAIKARMGIFESAESGTVFLDEFADVSLRMQSNLLRVLENNEIKPVGSNETRKINCKIIVATNKDPTQLVNEKKLRDDLYYRLNQFSIQLPPLRERGDDLIELTNYFLKINDSTKSLSVKLQQKIIHYSWPGNIRELKSVIEKMLIWYPLKTIYEENDLELSTVLNENKKNKANIDNSSVPKDNNDINHLLANSSTKAVRLKQLIAFLKESPDGVNRVKSAKHLNVSLITAGKYLHYLCDQGFIKKVMPNNSPRSHYFTLK